MLHTRIPILATLLLVFANQSAFSDESLSARAIKILNEHCVRCHNAEKTRGGLDLSTLATTLQGGATSDALVPNHPEQSALFTRAHAGTMPPERDGRKLNPTEVATLREWIQAGAAWPEKNVESQSLNSASPFVAPGTCWQNLGRCRPAKHRGHFVWRRNP